MAALHPDTLAAMMQQGAILDPAMLQVGGAGNEIFMPWSPCSVDSALGALRTQSRVGELARLS